MQEHTYMHKYMHPHTHIYAGVYVHEGFMYMNNTHLAKSKLS